ncbi:MAG: hypothetical protein IJI60_03790 [Bacilli bacterium]|nr:hypothetical protein [Bacilli bacterium]
MKKFRLFANCNLFQRNTYRIDRFSKAYSFFNSEYHFSHDLNENIILPFNIVEEEQKKKDFAKKRMEEEKAIAVPIGSEQYQFFASEFPEYRHSLDRVNNCVIIPRI